MPTFYAMPKAYQGDDYESPFEFKQEVMGESGIELQDLPIEGVYTGAVKHGSQTWPFDFSNSDLPTGLLLAELTASQTAEMPEEATYDIQRTLDGKVTTIFKGPFYTEQQVN